MFGWLLAPFLSPYCYARSYAQDFGKRKFVSVAK